MTPRMQILMPMRRIARALWRRICPQRYYSRRRRARPDQSTGRSQANGRSPSNSVSDARDSRRHRGRKMPKPPRLPALAGHMANRPYLMRLGRRDMAAYGDCDCGGDGLDLYEVRISRKLLADPPQTMAHIVIHELIHAADHDKSERWVEETARGIWHALDSWGLLSRDWDEVAENLKNN